MTTLTITPDIAKKRMKLAGRIAAGEKVAVTVKGFGSRPTATTRLRVLFAHNIIAQFPLPPAEGEQIVGWTVSGEDLTAVLNLNTVQAEKFARVHAVNCLFILDDVSDGVRQLYATEDMEILRWIKTPDTDVPVNLDDFPKMLEEVRAEINDFKSEMANRANEYETALSSAWNTYRNSLNVSIQQFTSTVMSAVNNKADAQTVNSHVQRSDNPHSVTKSQVGLGNVDNTSDASKPVSNLQRQAIEAAVSEVRQAVNLEATRAGGREREIANSVDAERRRASREEEKLDLAIRTEKEERNGDVVALRALIDKVDAAVLVSKTHAELLAMRNARQLKPGQQYRITDYVATTIQESTQSANHPFDIIVTADTVNKLNEVARATLHDDDTYFAACKLEAWQVWYCLDNDINRFVWADEENGKGVVYRLVDEFDNDVAYDFKGIKSSRTISGDTRYYYTFDNGNGQTDLSLAGYDNRVYSNSVKPARIFLNNSGMRLGCNIFAGQYINRNTIGADFTYGHTGAGFILNKIGDASYNFTAGADCFANEIGSSCSNVTLGDHCVCNLLQNECYDTAFGEYCQYNKLGPGCHSNQFGNNCCENSLEVTCHSNTFGVSCSGNMMSRYCSNNELSSGCGGNTFGEQCVNITLGSGCADNNFGSQCYLVQFGEQCRSNILAPYCRFIVFGRWDESESRYIPQSYFKDIQIEAGCSCITLYCSGTLGYESYYQNVTIKSGIKGTLDSYVNIVDVNSNQSFNTVYKPASSQEISI